MQTTVDLNDELLAAACARAAEQQRGLNALIEEALSAYLEPARAAAADGRPVVPRTPVELPIFRGGHGLGPLVANAETNWALFDACDGEGGA